MRRGNGGDRWWAEGLRNWAVDGSSFEPFSQDYLLNQVDDQSTAQTATRVEHSTAS